MRPAKVLRILAWVVVAVAFGLFLIIAFSGISSD